MSAFIAYIIASFWPYMVAAVGALGFGIYQRRAGAAAERARQAEARAKARDIADEIDDAIAGRSLESKRKELKKWSPDY